MLVIVGPTGTGKSETALLVAERLGGEIIGCDALQVYRGFDVATAKPSEAERRRIPHHLLNIVDPHRDFSLADYVREAEAAIGGVLSRGRVPIVVGGTGLYLRGVLRGVVKAPARDPILRARLRKMAERHGSARLHRWLRVLDSESAARLPPGDTQRILRALEIALKGKMTWSETLKCQGTWSGGAERYTALKIGLDMDRRLLAEGLDRRVERFFEAGLADEVQSLLDSGIPPEANAFKGIGYREALAAISEGIDSHQVIGEVQRNTRRYAKRQRTWFRREPGVIWLDAGEGSPALCERIVRLWRERIS